MLQPFIVSSLVLVLVPSSAAAGAGPVGRWLHPLCKPLAITKTGPFVVLPDGNLMTVDRNVLATSKDDGKAWTAISPVIQRFKCMGSCRAVSPLAGQPVDQFATG